MSDYKFLDSVLENGVWSSVPSLIDTAWEELGEDAEYADVLAHTGFERLPETAMGKHFSCEIKVYKRDPDAKVAHNLAYMFDYWAADFGLRIYAVTPRDYFEALRVVTQDFQTAWDLSEQWEKEDIEFRQRVNMFKKQAKCC